MGSYLIPVTFAIWGQEKRTLGSTQSVESHEENKKNLSEKDNVKYFDKVY